MAGTVAPNIVTDGLVLYLDAANTKSYVSGSTTWTDIAARNNGTLVNGPTYSSANGGSIIFDGTNDYCPITGNSFFQIPNPNLSQQNTAPILTVAPWYPIYDNFTIEVICKPTSTVSIVSEATTGTTGTSGQRYIMEHNKSTDGQNNGAVVLSVGTNAIQVFEHGDGHMPCLLSYTTSTTTNTHIVVTMTSKQPSLYINSILARTGLTSAKTKIELGAMNPGICSSFYTAFAGNVYLVKFYNRLLSQLEIQQNYNSTKTRFGI
jgi:hypothetical protein